MTKDYYLVLRVRPNASHDEIRSAFRQRALEVHPDVSGSGSDPFIQLQEAYSVLGNPRRRAEYDREAENFPVHHRPTAASPQRSRAEPLKPAARRSPARDISVFGSFDSFTPSFDELFDRFWGNFEDATRPKAERPENLVIDLPLTPAEALTGGYVRLGVPLPLTCHTCGGQGEIGGYLCWRCQGQGSVVEEFPVSLSYPPMRQDRVVQVALNDLGVHNLFLTVRFRV